MKKYEQEGSLTNKLLIIAIAVGLVAIATFSYSILNPRAVIYRNVTVYRNSTTSIPIIKSFNITSSLLQPPTSLSDAPVITQNESFGKRLTDINRPFNASELAIINNAPDSYFETAGNMVLNGTIPSCSPPPQVPCVGGPGSKVPPFILNGKPSVIYLGSITCIYCAENRWAMLLALSRFGNFSEIFKGYGSLGDLDVPTIYWAPAHYNTSSTVSGDFYESKYINFIAIEDAKPISGGFGLNPLSTMQQRVNQTGNVAYIDAMQYLLSTESFGGTPFTFWGAYEVGGADAVDLGNTDSQTNGLFQISQMTHSQILNQLSYPQDAFAWGNYAGADIYIAMVCQTLNNTAPVCSLPAIQAIQKRMGI